MASSSWKLLYCPLTRARLQNRNYPAIAVIRKVPGGETVACPHSPLAALSLPHNPCSSMISWQLNPQKNCFSLLQGLGSKIKSSSICSHAKGAIGKAVVCPHCSLTALSSPHTAWCFEVSWRLNPQNIFFPLKPFFSRYATRLTWNVLRLKALSCPHYLLAAFVQPMNTGFCKLLAH